MASLHPSSSVMLLLTAAILVTVGGREEDIAGDGACSLIFASPRHGSRIRRDARTFPLVILLRGSPCEEKGKVSVTVDGGKPIEVEHSQGKGVGDLIGILPNEKHGSDVTTHTLTASTAGSAHSSIKFSIGPAQPAVAIMEPTSGSETNDEPIDVFMTFADFEIPDDGQAVVAVDGVHFDTISSPHVNFVTLHRMPAGQHTVRVSLHDQTNEHVLASNEAEFTVLRPEVTLLSAYVESEKGRTRVIVRVSVQHLHSHGEFLLRVHVAGAGLMDGARPVLLPGHLQMPRPDVYHFTVGASGEGAARAGDEIQVALMKWSEGACISDDKNECGAEMGVAWKQVDSSKLELAAAPVRARQQEGRECPHVFISAGAHDGGDMFDLLAVGSSGDSKKWLSDSPSDRAWAWWKNLTVNIATDVKPRDFCVIAIEANPHMTSVLEKAAGVVRGGCRGVEVMAGTAAWVEDGSIDLNLDTRQEETGLSSSLLGGHPSAKGSRVTVKSISTPNLVRTARKRTGENGLVVLKMDIEGAEYEVLRAMIADGSLCSSVDYLFVEWHAMALGDGSDAPPSDFERVFEWISSVKGCRTRVFGGLY